MFIKRIHSSELYKREVILVRTSILYVYGVTLVVVTARPFSINELEGTLSLTEGALIAQSI
jgi:chorismate-pyruvate lyase